MHKAVKNPMTIQLFHHSTEVLEDICDGSQTHPNVNMREARYKIYDSIKQRQSEWKVSLKSTRTWVKVYTRCLGLL